MMINILIVLMVIPQGGKTTQAWSTRAIQILKSYRRWIKLILMLVCFFFPDYAFYFKSALCIVRVLLDLLKFLEYNRRHFSILWNLLDGLF